MKHKLFAILVRLNKEETGQGLVEYAMLMALVGFAATAGMGQLASAANSTFSHVGTIVSQYIM